MATAFKWLYRALGALAALSALALAAAYLLVAGSLPDYDRDFAVRGLGAPARILRDAHAVPHIRAETEEDAFFALGFAHAQDRLWQMELNRRAAQGRLAELFGPALLPVDRMMRALDLHRLARAAVARQSPRARAALEAYARGVNARLRAVADQALGRGAPEFLFFSRSIAPWTPADSLSIAKLLALRLSDHAAAEVRRAALSLLLPAERLRDIDPDYPEDGSIALPDYAALFPGLRFARPAAGAPRTAQALPAAGRGGASNAWALSGARSAAGKPILANDPHLWLSAPSIWHLARLELPGVGGIMGAAVPGLPLILIGRNERLAWGLTASYGDDADIYIEKLDPEDPSRYLTPEGYAPFRVRRELIQVAGRPPEEVELRWTRHGPVLPPDQLGLAQVTPAGHVAALSWTALTEDDRSFTAAFELMLARDIDEGAAAMADHVAPPLNVTLADERDVGMIVAGRLPLRHRLNPGKGRLPAPGWVAVNDWTGYLRTPDLPRVMRPASGAVANANNRTAQAPYPRHVSFHWGDPYRIRRIRKELASREFHSRDGAAALQNDAVSEMARAVLPLIARDLWWTGAAAPADPVEARRREALEMLGEWNGEMTQHAPEPLIFAEWMRRLTLRLAADELGPAVELVAGPRPVFVERVFRDIGGAGAWCDVNKTTRVETCAEMAALALDDALGALAERYGPDPRGWRWGEAHVATHEHTPLGRFALLAPLVNITHEASGGDFTLLRAQGAGSGPEPHKVVTAAGMRMVVDFADPDSSLIVISTGQSGHPLSRFYDDQSLLWRRGDALRMSLDFADAEAGAQGVTLLTPLGPEGSDERG
ncbi:penicillin acylase family protein [Oceanicella actignis]|uniref:penicillin acylase family protein n=1 Tax=Oceanicella actignis TaxID=1189325 RepID=UPI0011E87832|nr:penicillin acylase family protein [Oceanicella actignis]TYO91630.1 penicillin amidase [Oceanicella actignis]